MALAGALILGGVVGILVYSRDNSDATVSPTVPTSLGAIPPSPGKPSLTNQTTTSFTRGQLQALESFLWAGGDTRTKYWDPQTGRYVYQTTTGHDPMFGMGEATI